MDFATCYLELVEAEQSGLAFNMMNHDLVSFDTFEEVCAEMVNDIDDADKKLYQKDGQVNLEHYFHEHMELFDAQAEDILVNMAPQLQEEALIRFVKEMNKSRPWLNCSPQRAKKLKTAHEKATKLIETM